MNGNNASPSGSFQLAPAARNLLTFLDRRTDLVGTCCLGVGAAMATIYRNASPVANYLLAIGALLHLAFWFGRWWDRQ